MKKIIPVLLVLFFATVPLFMASALTSIPSNVNPGTTPDSGVNLQDTHVITTVDNLTNWFFAAFLIVAVWFLILAAFHFVTANGDTEKVNQARGEVMYAMIGVLIAVLAKGIVSLAAGLAK